MKADIDIGLKWILAILLGLAVIYVVYIGAFQKIVPVVEKDINVKATTAMNDLVRNCKDWAGALMLDSAMPSGLLTAAVSQDLAKDDWWEFCQTCYDSSPRARLPCRQCKAACVKLMIDEQSCRTNPSKFPDSFAYDLATHKAIVNGDKVDMSYNTAYLQCSRSRIGVVKEKVASVK